MAEDKLIECPVCRSQFDLDISLTACGNCPMASNCGKKKCPYCGVEFLPGLNLVEPSGGEKNRYD